MKFIVFLGLACCVFGMTSCEYEVAMMGQTEFDYHAHIHMPTDVNKHINDEMHIEIEFESHTGMTVHHVNVRIFNKLTGAELYNKPEDPHVHGSSGVYAYEDDVTLSEANGFNAHTDYVLEARVWAHEDGLEEVMEQVEFHIEP
jgi:hypothetical protein